MALSWLPLLTALIASGSALAGVLLSSQLARKDKAAERAAEARQEASDFLISRGEDLYLHLDRVDAYVGGRLELIELFCHGHINLDAFKAARLQKLAAFDQASVSRIALSVRAFFPELRALHDEQVKNLERLTTVDEVVADASEINASLLYRISADATRLQKSVEETGTAMRDRLTGQLASAFAARSAAV